jgi:hypothetical protein
MKIGFTGSRRGMTAAQQHQLELLLRGVGRVSGQVREWPELHHGDCVGADDIAGQIAHRMDYRVVSHPPTNERLRAHSVADEVREPLDYLVRNRLIVDETEMLIAAPDGPERLHSGTWATIRYARSLGRQVVVLRPGDSDHLKEDR